jgi:hypothetical protein
MAKPNRTPCGRVLRELAELIDLRRVVEARPRPGASDRLSARTCVHARPAKKEITSRRASCVHGVP